MISNDFFKTIQTVICINRINTEWYFEQTPFRKRKFRYFHIVPLNRFDFRIVLLEDALFHAFYATIKHFPLYD